jgi:hypothetical protein
LGWGVVGVVVVIPDEKEHYSEASLSLPKRNESFLLLLAYPLLQKKASHIIRQLWNSSESYHFTSSEGLVTEKEEAVATTMFVLGSLR